MSHAKLQARANEDIAAEHAAREFAKQINPVTGGIAFWNTIWRVAKTQLNYARPPEIAAESALTAQEIAKRALRLPPDIASPLLHLAKHLIHRAQLIPMALD